MVEIFNVFLYIILSKLSIFFCLKYFSFSAKFTITFGYIKSPENIGEYLMKQQTLVLIKPEAMQKNLTGYVLNKLAERELQIVGIKPVKVSKELAEEHYKQLKNKPFFPELIEYIQGGGYGINNLIAIVYEGENAIQVVREVAGATNPEEAKPTSIRGSFGRITTKGVFENVIHASSSPEDAETEVKLWFSPTELMNVIYPIKITNISKNETVWE